MQITSILADIKRSIKTRQALIIVNKSVYSLNVLKVFLKAGYIAALIIKKKKIGVILRYSVKGIPLIQELKIASKSSLDISIKAKALYNLMKKKQYYTCIITSNKGIFTGEECFNKNIGGKIIC
jgi:ribosomal protein S8